MTPRLVRSIAKVKQRWLISKVKHRIRAFAVVSTHQSALDPRDGLWPFSLCVIHEEGLCPRGRLGSVRKTAFRRLFW
jgi:hypothetical protein